MSFTFKVQGLADTLKKFEKLDKDLSDKIDKQLDNSSKNVAAAARTDAPIGRRKILVSSIGYNISERFEKSIFALAPYAPYVEFGTGSRVFENTRGFTFNANTRAYARGFFVSGKGRQPAQPYLFPAFEREKIVLLNRIKADIRQSTLKGSI